ncbi:DNRLRE domain-containing protein [Streptomyces sp. NPDC127084]|uniref:DNRLRE domain-containing protein n=1 Tax=Streptomyces sp. NPDC127084 TaxID=3347133 RepID=UPI00365555D2
MRERTPANAGRRSRLSPAQIRPAAIAVSVVMAVTLLDGAAFAAPGAPTAGVPEAGGSSSVRAVTASRVGRGPAEAADAASALLMAHLQGRDIEITGERTGSTSSYALPNGSTSVRSYTGPIRVKDAAGRWQRIDTSLIDGGDTVRPRRAAADISLSDGGSGEPLVEVARGKQSLGIGWTGPLPKPELKGSTATYRNAVPGGGDLVVTALKEGFSHSVVLHEAPKGQVEYRIPVEATGLTLKETADKRLRWDDARNKTRATAPAPVMWDSSYDRASGDAEYLAAVDVEVEKERDGSGQVLVLKPNQKFLSDPDLTYPVTIDPTDSLMGPVTDTWVQYDDYLTSQRGSTELKAGTYNGAEKARSFLQFNVDKYKGKVVTDTDLRLYSYYSSTCNTANAGNEVRRITAAWDPSAVTWSNQPATTATGAVVNKSAKGYNSTCPAGHVSWDIDAIVQAWADGQPNYGVRIAAVDESDVLTWRRYHSANQTDGSHNAAYEPSLTVTYNTKPGAAVPVSPISGAAVSDTTPTLTGKGTDADGNTVQLSYEIWTSTGTAALQTGKSAFTASGANASWTPATALSPGTYKWRAAVYDGTSWNGTWSAWQTFTVDTAKPASTAVSSSDFPAAQWSGAPNANGDFTGSFTFTPPANDVKDIQYKLDSGAWAVAATTGSAVTKSLTFKAGPHTITAHTRDAAGNVSADTVYGFNAGKGAALTAPGPGERPARRISLTAQGDTSYTGVRYQFRRGETDQWQDVPTGHVRVNSTGTVVSGWPVAVSGGKPAPLTWDITTTLAEDGPVDVRALFGNGAATEASPEVSVTVDRAAGAAPSLPVGPGHVNSLTGDFTLEATDANGAGTSVTRTAYSRDDHPEDEGQAKIFGPEWVSGIYAEITDSAYAGLRKTSGTSVEIMLAEDSAIGFTATSGGGWQAEEGAEHLTLAGSLTSSFTLTDDDGAVTVFKKVDPAAETWQVDSTRLPTDNSTTRVVSEKVPTGDKVLARPKYLIAPSTAASATACEANPATAGCERLEFVYATATTATGSTAAADFGDFTGQVKEIRLWSTAPGAAAATAQAISTYRYDKDGLLRQQWDPRLPQATGVQYTYGSGNRVEGMTPGTELPWTFAYGKAGNSAAAGAGMLLKASRPSLKQGSKTEADGGSITNSVVYDVPLTGTNAPHQMGVSDVAVWGQTDRPTDATAVFPPDAVPAGHDGSTLTATAYKRAVVTYVNVSGREVNTAVPGGRISTTGYNADGAVVHALSAANRELALATTGPALDRLARLGIKDVGSAERAALLAETREYSTDGLRLLHSYGPLHLVELQQGAADLPAGTEAPARLHTAISYDEGRPADSPVSGQATTVTAGAFLPGRTGGDLDTRTTVTTYDWAKGLPLTRAEDPAGLNHVTSSAYDAQGRVVSTTLPKGSAAGTRVTAYYTADGTGRCGNRPEWVDKVCSEGPADPADGTTSVYEYDAHGQVAKTTANAGGSTRVTQVTRDSAGRVIRTAVTGGEGTAVPETVRTYDPVSGKPTSIAAGGKTASYAYDALGRAISYDDGAGNVTVTEYDPLGRLAKVSDSAPSTVTYAYDTAKEPRGLPTSMTDSVAGTFGASYDASGDVAGETLPGGYTLGTVTDETGFTTSRTYTRDADGTALLTDVAVPTVHGQVSSGARSAGSSNGQSFRYDRTGRLTDVDEAGAYGQQHRAYDLDANSNRTRLVSTRDQDGTPVSTTTQYAYDDADRLTGTGITYDAFGRTLTKPGSTFGYYTNDLVHRQTSGNQRQTWSLDAQGRLGSWTTEALDGQGAVTAAVHAVNHYRNGSDIPSWTVEDVAADVRSRNVTSLSGKLAAITGTDGDTVLQLTDLHDDAGVALPLDPAKPLSVADTDEYGNVREGTASARYNWLAAHQRDSATPSGVILMGVRQYDPSTGRFLSVDPVYGGNDNPYEYCSGDGSNCTDLGGDCSSSKMCCTFSVDSPHPSHTARGRINVHADMKCKKKVGSYSIHITLYRSRWYGWEKMDTGYASGNNAAKARAVANWAPRGTCYYYKGVGEFMISTRANGRGTRGTATATNYDRHYRNDQDEMCL